MILYAESSAVLSWLLDEPHAEPSREALSGADGVVASRLTLFECTRTIRRAESTGHLGSRPAAHAQALLAEVAARWELADISREVLAAADRGFPLEPLRSLDALHLGTALFLRQRLPDLAFLTLDDRIAANARLLGFPVLPGPPAPRKGRRR
ncbi:MAG: type II toxin-antitoxin system VapC family toxin [Planctomycetes bacterium]|nr:type II toxin-antitoxin system VapC family toxin [Planctomycetota bacterium]